MSPGLGLVLGVLASVPPALAQGGHGSGGRGPADPCVSDPSSQGGEQVKVLEGYEVRFAYPCHAAVGTLYDFTIVYVDEGMGHAATPLGSSFTVVIEYWNRTLEAREEATARLGEGQPHYKLSYSLKQRDAPHFFVPVGGSEAVFMLNDVEEAAGPVPSPSQDGATDEPSPLQENGTGPPAGDRDSGERRSPLPGPIVGLAVALVAFLHARSGGKRHER